MLAPGGPPRVAGAPLSVSPAPALPASLPARIAGLLRIASGPLDGRTLIVSLLGAGLYLLSGWASLLLALAGDGITPVWLPNALAVLLLLRARLRHEWLFLGLAFCASLGANAVAQQPWPVACLFSLANLAEIMVVLALTRRADGGEGDMTRLVQLARFVWAGGLVGPLVSGLLVAPVLGQDWDALRVGLVTWFLTDSMAMLLVVPAGLLLIDRLRGTLPQAPARGAESSALLIGGMTCALLVFNQAQYPLIFLIQPITLLHAFRLGSLGTAMHVTGVALVAGAMTWAGLGPIAAVSAGGIAQSHLLQAFIAANFLTGLPVAAILAGRDRMVARLEAGKRQVDLLADNITDAVLRYGLDGSCTYASPSVREVLGVPPETFVGKPVTARLHPETRDRAVLALGRLLDGISDKERVTYRRFKDNPDGTPVFLEADCAIIRNPDTGAREGVVVAARDVTERVELELLLTRARRHAENAAQAKSEFLANMSHEIRTPMNGVLGFAELLLQGELDPQQQRYAEMIVQSGRSMMMLLNDVLDLSKIESGQFSIDEAPVDLDATLAECAALHRQAAEKKGLSLAFDGDPDAAGLWLLTDGLRLRQIVLNAVKFTEAGTIRLSWRRHGKEVRIGIADSGIGISAGRLETIFEPFVQGESDIARRFGGTGLGLSISRQLANLLGGRIEVESTPGEGSRFTLLLPARIAAPPAAEPDDIMPGPLSLRSPAGDDPAPDLPRASRILLVEDHDINRTLVTEMLERCGQEVAIAHDGNEAIAMVIDSILRGQLYDLVLMDVQMPGCDGYAATRAIRAEGIGPDVLPVVALTANAYPEDIAAARAAGMQAHLAKPIALAQLVRALQRWLPTTIVEDPPVEQARTAAAAAAASLSPRLVARWEARRHEAVEAVRGALRDGTLAAPQAQPHAAERLALLLHKVAGTAGMFGEAALGEAAAALERALGPESMGEQAGETCVTLAREWLALADRPSDTEPRSASRAAG
ncbi:MAG: response regulator [Erythrobacter sp.]|jgi:PAS domain S-box-containing protein|uniref:ATP-binding protein n=1 Tax=Erythrobacter sp. TaxID=1042 RepID=UPI002B4AA6C8|nr:ATP-binding protein [Erythrobacter sp.]WRH69926.1 MAG: response regulator [Erythrobacter sp.]